MLLVFGLLVRFLRILCNGLCTARSFDTEGEEQTCRVGCPDEPDSLSHYNECPLLYKMLTSIWGQATVLPRRSHLLHDLITQVMLRSLQYGIVVMASFYAFVYAHHQHRRSIENPGNFGDCMKGRIRFMTDITPAYAHAYQVTCLTRHMPAVPRPNFRLPKPKARYPHLLNVRITKRERGNDYRGWAIYTDGGTRVVNGETLAGWSVIYRSFHGRIDVTSLMKFLEPTRKPKVIHTNNSWKCGKVCEVLSWIIARLHHIDQKQMGLLRQQCPE